MLNKRVTLNQSIRNFSIHGNNPKLIYLLENEFEIDFKNALKEAIKCHHNQIADYLCNNYGYSEIDDIISPCFEFYNFALLPNCQIKYYFFNACGYNHVAIVKLLLKNESNIDINETIVISHFFSNKINHFLNFERIKVHFFNGVHKKYI